MTAKDALQVAAKLPPADARALLARASAILAADATGPRRVDLETLLHPNRASHQAASDEAEAAFASDMQPLCEAVVAALQTGDKAALEGLRGMFAGLLREANAAPALARVLTRELGAAMIAGLHDAPYRAPHHAPGNGSKNSSGAGDGKEGASHE